MDVRETVRRRIASFFTDDEDCSLATDPEAVREARAVLAAAFRLDVDGQAVVDGDGLMLGAWLFWCRWQLAPTDSGDPDAQTAYRLFAVLRAVDPDAPIPPDIATALTDPRNDEPIADLLHHEARDLVEACLDRFDDTAVDLGVALARSAVAGAAEGSAEQAEYACNLGAGLFSRYQHHSVEADFDDAVQQFQLAATSGHGSPAEQARYLANLGVALHTRFLLAGQPEDLAEAVRAHRHALRAQPAETRYLAQYAAVLHTRYEHGGRIRDLDRAIRHADSGDLTAITNRAGMLRSRYEHSGDPDDLALSATLLDDVVRATPANEPDRARRLSSLATTLVLRFAATDDRGDLDLAIRLHQEAVDTARADDPRRADYLSNLGDALQERYEDGGDYADLQRALAAHAEAAPDGDAVDARRAGNRANSFAARFNHLSDVTDLDRAMQGYVAALDRLPPRHIHRGSHLSNLGSLWFMRFNRTHDRADLDSSVALDRASVRCTPPGHRDRSRRLANLGAALDTLYENTGDPATLDEAIAAHRAAHQAAPPTLRRHHGCALGVALHLRFHLRGGKDDLDEAIALHRASLECRADHPDRPRRRTLLASALLTRQAEYATACDLDEAIGLIRHAAAATPERHVQRIGREVMLGSALTRLADRTGDRAAADEAITLLRANADLSEADSPRGYRWRTLGDALEARWNIAGELPDLHAAVAAYRSAIAATPANEPEQALNRYDLGGVLAALADATDDPAPRAEAAAEFRDAAAQVTAPVPLRIFAAGEWAALALAAGDPATATRAFALALDLLPRLAWLGLARSDQERMLADWSTLAPDATAAALLSERSGQAVELVDRGRSLLWEQHLQLHHDQADLDRRNPRLARRLRRIRAHLAGAENLRRADDRR